jgi:5-methylcytosine-specific restriction protein A
MPAFKVCVAPGCDELSLPDLSYCQDHEAKRVARLAARRASAGSRGSVPAKKLYDSKEWRRARLAQLKRHPLCEDCLELGAVVEATEVDHRVRHEGDRKKFKDRSNLQSLCKPCHSRKTAGEVFHGRGVVEK